MMQTTSGSSAAIASSMEAAARGGGTKMAEAEAIEIVSCQSDFHSSPHRHATMAHTTSLLDGLFNGSKNRKSKVSLASLFWISSSNDLGSVLQSLVSVEGALSAGET